MIDNNRQEPILFCFKVEKCIEFSNITVSHIRKCLLPLLDEDDKPQEKYKLEEISNCSVGNNLCDHCSKLSEVTEVTEDLNHLLWECPGSRETWNNLQSILSNLSIDYQILLKSIIMGIQNAPISVELVVTIIACLLARKGRPKLLSKEVIINEIKNIIKVKQYKAMKKGKTEFFKKKWEKFESLKN